MNRNISKKRFCLTALFLFLTSLFYYLSCFKWAVVFFHRGGVGGDGDIFLAMGRFMQHGLVPYIDFFDHKGPITMFLNSFIQSFPNFQVGKMVVSVTLVTFSLGGVYQILGLFYQQKARVLLTLFSMVLFKLYGAEELTESYCLPFLMWSMYFAISYMKNSSTKPHNKWYSFFYGITFAVCFLTIVRNAVVLCCVLVMGIILLIRQKQWKNLVINLVFFLTGLILVCLPFCIYFLQKGALYDMFYGTIIFNVKYATSIMVHYTWLDYFKRIVYWLHLVIVAGLIGILHARFVKKDLWVSYTVIFTSLSCCIVYLSGLMFEHYCTAYIPILIVAIGILKDLFKVQKIKAFLIVVLTGCLLLLAYKTIRNYYNSYRGNTSKGIELYTKEALEVANQIPKEDRDSVYGYNILSYFYIATDIDPCHKYFTLQDWQSKSSDAMKKELLDYFHSKAAKYIVISTTEGNVYLDEILKDYHEVYQAQTIKLLERN